ncbi:MAG: peptidase U32 family protein, partial [Bacillota bacterium]
VDIKEKTDIELEMFVHGAMCISYSGRCLLSNYMVGRDANKGKCAHSCRWKYHLIEEKRPGEYYPIHEDENGTYIMNSKDLCLIEYIPDIIKSGVSSLKIEGRMKSLHYVATVTSVYRKALDTYYAAPDDYHFNPQWLSELKKVSHRDYTTGFFLSKPGPKEHNYGSSVYHRDYDFMGVIRDFIGIRDNQETLDISDDKHDIERIENNPDSEEIVNNYAAIKGQVGEAVVEVRHKFFKGDNLEIIGPEIEPFNIDLKYIINENGDEVETAPHPKELIRIPVNKKVSPYCIVRREKKEND